MNLYFIILAKKPIIITITQSPSPHHLHHHHHHQRYFFANCAALDDSKASAFRILIAMDQCIGWKCSSKKISFHPMHSCVKMYCQSVVYCTSCDHLTCITKNLFDSALLQPWPLWPDLDLDGMTCHVPDVRLGTDMSQCGVTRRKPPIKPTPWI